HRLSEHRQGGAPRCRPAQREQGGRGMTAMPPLTQEEREATLGGSGCARKRKEDVRFIQGRGRYVDDIKLPGMLFGDFVRSPYAHARIKRIDKSKVLAL